MILVWAPLLAAQPERLPRVWDHGSHTQPSAEERALRDLLGRYRSGDIASAVRGLFVNAPGWAAKAVDAALLRADEEIRYHRRPENRMGAARQERVERYLRADRLQGLLLAATLQLEAAGGASAVDVVGSHVVGSERAIDRIFAMRSDFDQNGPVPWPIGMEEPWQQANSDDEKLELSLDWPDVRAFVRRWYSAAAASLQRLVEVRLAPALIARGLARFPGDPDLLLARGSSVEARLALSRLDASLASTLYAADVRQRWRNELSDAEQDFDRAARSVGPSSEAAVRLGRVRLLKGDLDRARETLDRVLAGDVGPEMRYLALVFRAAASEQAGDIEAAARTYEAAANATPGAQAAWLGLARIADEQNRPADARKFVERALAVRGDGIDPWRRYIHGQAWQLGERIAGLRTLEAQ